MKHGKLWTIPSVNDDVDILFISLPRRNPHINYATLIPEALGRLKASVQQNGYSARTIDFDNPYFKEIFKRQDIYYELDEYFRNIFDRKFHGARNEYLGSEALEFYEEFLTKCVEKVASIDHEWLGISIFSEQSIRCAIDFLEIYRERFPDKKIVIGGYCMQIWAVHHEGSYLDTDQEAVRVGDFIKNLGLTDYFVTGEGEHVIVELLNGNVNYPGINNYSPKQIDNLNDLPYPDYTEFDFSDYIFPNPTDLPNLLFPMLSVTGSRGCVRNCVFCDINTKWPKFRYVGPENLAAELIHYYEKYGVMNFHWSDSLVNASPPILHRFLEIIVDYQTKHDIKFWQTGSFIVREERQMGEDTYRLLKEAGFDVMIFGVESGSPAVREAMNKKYSQEAIYYTINMCRKYDIEIQCLLIVGYPTETRKQFQETLDVIYHFKPQYKDDRRVVWSLSAFGFEYDADETPLNKDPAIHDIEFDEILGWKSPELNSYLANKRCKALYEFLENLGYPIYSEWNFENTQEIEFIEDNLRTAGRSDDIESDEHLYVQAANFRASDGVYDYRKGMLKGAGHVT